MNPNNSTHTDPSHPDTINFYLREGRRQRSCQAWSLIHAIGRLFDRENRSRQPRGDE